MKENQVLSKKKIEQTNKYKKTANAEINEFTWQGDGQSRDWAENTGIIRHLTGQREKYK